MTRHNLKCGWPCVAMLLTGCASTHHPPDEYEEVPPKMVVEPPAPASGALPKLDADTRARGRYLVEIMDCGACHTDGAIVGQPNPAKLLAGSRTGIAYTDPRKNKYPGVVYPPNLTPDRETGLGNWSDQEIAAAIGDGMRRTGPGHLVVMSWPLYGRMPKEDIDAIVAYLRSIPTVKHRVPGGVPPGTKAPGPYVHFGMYRSKG